MSAPKHYRVKNWENFQHYKNRNPPWIKLHFAIFASEDWAMLADASKLLAVVCMLVASRHDGMVPNNPGYIKRVAYLDDLPDLTPLIECGFLENPQADASAAQADASTPQADARPETEQRQNRTEKKEVGGADAPPKPYRFQGAVIRLDEKQFETWRKAYHAIPDYAAELTRADDYYASHPPPDGKWFFPVSRWLAKAHEQALAARRSIAEPKVLVGL